MIFQVSRIDVRIGILRKIEEKMVSKMEGLNLRPSAYENQTRDAPKMPQDALGRPKTALRRPQDDPKTGPRWP